MINLTERKGKRKEERVSYFLSGKMDIYSGEIDEVVTLK